MTLDDLERIKEEFEQINRGYRTTFTLAGRLELVERVTNLMTAIKEFEASRTDQREKTLGTASQNKHPHWFLHWESPGDF